jgi:hypothetical protein
MEIGYEMDTEDARALSDRIGPLDEEGRRAVRRYWEQVIREEWVPPSRQRPARVSMGELDERRGRRAARRSLSLVTRSGQVRAGAAGEAA